MCGPRCGLIEPSSLRPVPLQGIWVDVQVKGFVADVWATLRYKNEEVEEAVEAVFVFPMDENSAVYSFDANVQGKNITVDLKEQPSIWHSTAICRGHKIILLEDVWTCGDVFSCSVGNLSAGQEAEVNLKYVQELPVEADGAVSFILPAGLKPTYTARATPTQVLGGEIPYMVSAHFQSLYGIAKIESNCDITPIQYTSDNKTGAKVSLVGVHRPEGHVKILAYYTEPNKPTVMVEAGLGSTDTSQQGEPPDSLMADPVAMLNFFPSFPSGLEQPNTGEFIFLVDRSGSMRHELEPDHQKIAIAQMLLTLCLKNLPLGSYFNVYGFGSFYEAFFPESVEYTRQSLEKALKMAWTIDASFGGTEILQILQKVYKTAGRAGYPRNVFIFMDGEVGNKKEVITEVKNNADGHRCFTIGIGKDASKSLIKGMAKAGGGMFEFITGLYEMNLKALRILKSSLQPAMKDVSLTWTLPPGIEATGLSEVPASIFRGQRLIAYARLKGKIENEDEGGVCLEYKCKDQVWNHNLSFPLNQQKSERATIHKLAAKSLISELKYGKESKSEEVKMKILNTSLQSGIVSPLTKFVAVNKDTGTTLESPFVVRDFAYKAFSCEVPPTLFTQPVP